MQIKVGKVSSPTANVSQVLKKVSESEKVTFLWYSGSRYFILLMVLKVLNLVVQGS